MGGGDGPTITELKLHYWHRQVRDENNETALEECVVESAIEDFPEDIFTGLKNKKKRSFPVKFSRFFGTKA